VGLRRLHRTPASEELAKVWQHGGHSAVEDQELARRILGYPDDRFCALLIPLGYPADRPLRSIRRPSRRPFGEVVHRERW
jgi:nitroreductase